jgi:Kdo2-lipid IVA lauroyltransferase/acyltransferase
MKRIRQRLEYCVVWLLLKLFALLPRQVARSLGARVAWIFFALLPKMRRTAMFNLHLAFPEWSDAQRKRVIRGMVRQIGWMFAEFARFPEYKRHGIEKVVALDGNENFLAGQQRGKGVLFLTGHFSAWELAPFAHSLYGYPLHFLVRAIDNPYVNELVSRYRSLSGNVEIEKNESARAILRVMRDAGTVGILMDQNTMPEESVFADFFGIPASTTSGFARLALRTDAAVVPVYVFWSPAEQRYHLRFEPPLELTRSGDGERDILENTAQFNRVIEGIIRRNPDGWIWMHQRWRVRPEGEKAIYPW